MISEYSSAVASTMLFIPTCISEIGKNRNTTPFDNIHPYIHTRYNNCPHRTMISYSDLVPFIDVERIQLHAKDAPYATCWWSYCTRRDKGSYDIIIYLGSYR